MIVIPDAREAKSKVLACTSLKEAKSKVLACTSLKEAHDVSGRVQRSSLYMI